MMMKRKEGGEERRGTLVEESDGAGLCANVAVEPGLNDRII